MSLMFSSWLSQFRSSPHKIPFTIFFASAKGSVRGRTASSSLSSCCCCGFSFCQGNKPLRGNPVCVGQVTLFKADFSPLSRSKLVFRQLSYNLAFYEPSSLRCEAFKEMNEYNSTDKAPCSLKNRLCFDVYDSVFCKEW